MTHYGTWVSYGGTGRVFLALVVLAAAVAVGYAGIRLPLPLRPAPLSPSARTFLLLTWGMAITAFLICLFIYAGQARRDHVLKGTPADPITPVTLICCGILFFIIIVASSNSSNPWRVTLTSAVIAAIAAPMIFEFPFDLIVMTRTYPPIPPDPTLYRVLFFAPLFLVEFTTLALLTLSPLVRLSRAAVFLVAAMLLVFAFWGLAGFAYPSAPVPFALNVVSKVLAFAAALCLFLPPQAFAGAEQD